MPSFSEIKEQLQNGWSDFQKLLIWGSQSALKRLFIGTALAALLLSIQYWYINDVFSSSVKSTEDYQIEVGLLQKELNYQRTIDWLELCVSSKASANTNSAMYCQKADIAYAKVSRSWPTKEVQSFKDASAYEGMKVQVSDKLRSLSLDRLNSKSTETNLVLAFLLSNLGIALAICVTLLVVLSAFLYMHWHGARRSHSLPPP